jgi:hypothetical protein
MCGVVVWYDVVVWLACGEHQANLVSVFDIHSLRIHKTVFSVGANKDG